MKRYRQFEICQHGVQVWNRHSTDRAQIVTRFALLPIRVDNLWIWLQKYFALITITSAFSLGGTTSVSKGVTARSCSIFGFKKFLKQEGIIRNEYKNSLSALKRIPVKDLNPWQLYLLGKTCPNQKEITNG